MSRELPRTQRHAPSPRRLHTQAPTGPLPLAKTPQAFLFLPVVCLQVVLPQISHLAATSTVLLRQT